MILIVGAGEVGFNLARRLAAENKDVVLIDQNEQTVRVAKETLDVRCVVGAGSKPGVLKEAGVEKAEMLIAVTNSDEINILSCFIAGSKWNIPTKVARIRDPEYVTTLGSFGESFPHIDLVINPEREAADDILRLLEVPWATEVVDFAEGRAKLVGVFVEQDSRLAEVRLKDLKKSDQTELPFLIAAIARGNQTIIPRGKDTIQAGDIIYTMTAPEKFPEVMSFLGKKKRETKRVMISGGYPMFALYLTEILEDKGISVKVLEKDKQHCEALAEAMKKGMVLYGDATDRDLLIEEGIRDIDVFIAAQNDEEENILTSLLAKRLGAKHVFSVINKMGYMPLANAIGIDVVVSPRLVAVNRILQYIRKGMVLSVMTLKGEEAEAIEFVALETSDIVDKPLKEVKFPHGSIIGMVVRGEEVIIPRGNDCIQHQDRVIVFTLKKSLPKLEKVFAVKPEYF